MWKSISANFYFLFQSIIVRCVKHPLYWILRISFLQLRYVSSTLPACPIRRSCISWRRTIASLRCFSYAFFLVIVMRECLLYAWRNIAASPAMPSPMWVSLSQGCRTSLRSSCRDLDILSGCLPWLSNSLVHLLIFLSFGQLSSQLHWRIHVF